MLQVLQLLNQFREHLFTSRNSVTNLKKNSKRKAKCVEVSLQWWYFLILLFSTLNTYKLRWWWVTMQRWCPPTMIHSFASCTCNRNEYYTFCAMLNVADSIILPIPFSHMNYHLWRIHQTISEFWSCQRNLSLNVLKILDVIRSSSASVGMILKMQAHCTQDEFPCREEFSSLWNPTWCTTFQLLAPRVCRSKQSHRNKIFVVVSTRE